MDCMDVCIRWINVHPLKTSLSSRTECLVHSGRHSRLPVTFGSVSMDHHFGCHVGRHSQRARALGLVS
ncbi:hypothetical protein Hanom_Chr02g00137661 [Helianthus anomalus]